MLGGFALIGWALIIWIASLFFNFSFWVGFGIWVVIFILMAAEEASKDEEKNSKDCPMCSERINKKAKKCKHCGEMIA